MGALKFVQKDSEALSDVAKPIRQSSRRLLKAAVHRNKALTKDGLAERVFSLAFRQLVYTQIWEDPAIDMEALQIAPDSRVVTIGSGGCNVLSYLTADPVKITAIDLNAAHIALVRLKLCAAEHLESHDEFMDFFGRANRASNVAIYDRLLRGALDRETRAYWEGRDLSGRRRITWFARNFYRFGMLGRAVGIAHLFSRVLGADPKAIMQAQTLREQREIFNRSVAPLFDKRIVRWVFNNRLSLYGLGIPPAQYDALTSDSANSAAEVVRSRLERLACGYDLTENYFAWQAFARGYSSDDVGPLPPYLQAGNFDTIKSRSDRVGVRLVSMSEYLREQTEASVDRYVLLDAQDWMTDDILKDLWEQITRTSKSGARVIFRTAGEEDILPNRVPREILDQWTYQAEQSRDYTERDRSAIYGGFHLYVRKGV